AHIHRTRKVEIPHSAGVDTPARLLQLVDNFHRPDLRRSRYGPDRKGSFEQVDTGLSGRQPPRYSGSDMHDMGVADDGHELVHVHAVAHAAEIVPAEVDEHNMLSSLLFIC